MPEAYDVDVAAEQGTESSDGDHGPLVLEMVTDADAEQKVTVLLDSLCSRRRSASTRRSSPIPP